MSHTVNNQLIERAQECAEYWEGTTIAGVIRQQLEANDLEGLWHTVTLAEGQMAQEEIMGADLV